MNSSATDPKHRPGIRNETTSRMIYIRDNNQGPGKLTYKVALITDSGIGKAVALHFAREGADVAILHHPAEDKDAKETQRLIRRAKRDCLLICGDLIDPYGTRQEIRQIQGCLNTFFAI
ncbi:MAG: hypothetical protein U0X91_02960 [Spirosomataceae bacterium]